jgi:sarcosine oxidase
LSLSQTVKPPTGEGVGRRRWDVIVVGCGVMGASASYNLAKRGLRVLTIERYGVNHEFGSSHGETRIIRLAYYEDPRYVPLLRRAYDSWRETEKRAGKRLLQISGGLVVGRPDGEMLTGVLRSARAHHIPHEVLSAAEAEARFEAFTLGDGMSAVYEEGAGILFAEECVRAFVGLASEEGCDFRFSEQVTRLRSGREGVEVETSTGIHTADRIVLCAGAWNAILLGGAVPLACERQVPLWFSSGGLSSFMPGKMPVFVMEEKPNVVYYGVPDVGRGVKVARTHGGELSNPDLVKRDVEESDIAPVREFIGRHLKKLQGPPIAATTCIYSNTPDFNFAIGPLGSDQKVTLVSACSGHGFKFGSVMGEVAADLATGKDPGFDLSFLSPDRFAEKSGA